MTASSSASPHRTRWRPASRAPDSCRSTAPSSGPTPSHSIAPCFRARFDRVDREPRPCLGDTGASLWRSTSSRMRRSASRHSASHTCCASRAGSSRLREGFPPFEQYVAVMPFVAVLVPLAYYFQGVYRLRRGRSRVDDFFLVFIGTVVAVILGIVTRCTSTRTTRRPRSRRSARIRSRASSGPCSW